MLQKISTLAQFLSLSVVAAAGTSAARSNPAWRRDPLAHPALAGMSSTELADLPHAALRAICRD